MAKCRGCKAEIVWVGKIPCNPDLIMYREKKGAKGKAVTPNGEVISCVFEGDINKATGMGYVSHFATCPAADQFRRKRG